MPDSSTRSEQTRGKSSGGKNEMDPGDRQFRDLAEMIPQLAWIANADGWIFWYNRRWYEYTGTIPQQMEGWGWQSVHDPKELPKVLERWRASIATGQPFDMIFPLRGADGVFRPFLTRVMPLRDEGGQVIRWFGTNTDISQQIQVEQQVRTAKDRLEAFVKNAPASLAMFDRSMRYLTCSGRWQQDTGLQEQELLGKSHYAVLPDLPAHWKELHRRGMAGEIIKNEESWLAADGKQHIIRWEIHPWGDSGTETGGIIICMEDITERKLAETRLAAEREALARMHALSERMLGTAGLHPILQEIMEAAVEMAHANRGTLQLLEGDSLRIVAHHGHAQPFLDFFADATHHASACGAAMEGGERVVVHDIEESLLFAGTDSLQILRNADVRAVQSTPLMSRSGKLMGILTTQWDVPHSPDEHELWRIDLLARQAADMIEHAQAEQAIRRSEERLALVVDAADLGTWDWDIPSGELIWSDRCRHMFGVALGTEISYERFLGSLHTEDRERVDRDVRLAINRHETYDTEMRTIWPDGTLHWIRSRGRAYYDHKGTPVRMSGAVLEVTDQRQAAESLRESEERYRATFENAAIGISHVGLDGRWLRFNDEICRITGYSRAELSIMTFMDITHSDDLDADWNQKRQLLAGNICTYTMDKRYIRKDGSTVWIRLTASLMRDGTGRPAHFISIIEDIDAPKRMQELLLHSEERFRSIFEYAPTGIAITDRQGRFVQCNPAYSAMLGFSQEEFARLKFAELIHPDDRQGNLERVRDLLDGKISHFQIENRYLKKDGEEVWVHKFVSLLRNLNGEAMQLALVTDMSERKRAETALIRAEKLAAAGRLAGTIAHEVNNPLEAINNLIYLARRSPGLSQDVEEMLDLAMDELARIAHLTKQTLGFYRETRERREFNIAEQMNGLKALYERRLTSRGIDLRLDIDSSLHAFGNASEFRQLTANLIANACDAITDRGGHIVIRARQVHRGSAPPHVRITFADTGSGIPPQHLRRIFDPFFTTKEHVGTGLGLWLSREITVKNDARIRLRTRTNPGQSGTVFVVLWPSEAPVHASNDAARGQKAS